MQNKYRDEPARQVTMNFRELYERYPSGKIYRFRKFDENNKYQETAAIQNSYLYASSFYNLNDPMEAFFGTVGYVGEGGSIQESMNKASEVRDEVARLNCEIGLLSFTNSFENLPMWAYYADNFSGICLEFDIAALCCGDLFSCGPSSIKYSEKLPPYHDIDEDMRVTFESHLNRNFLTKPLGWAHEVESRFLTKTGENYYPAHALKSIWVGPRNNHVECLIGLGQAKGIKVIPTIVHDYFLKPDGAIPISPCLAGDTCAVLGDFVNSMRPMNSNYCNNLYSEFNNLARRRGFTLLSISEGNDDLEIKSKYKYANGAEKSFTEIYKLDQFKNGNLWSEPARIDRLTLEIDSHRD